MTDNLMTLQVRSVRWRLSLCLASARRLGTGTAPLSPGILRGFVASYVSPATYQDQHQLGRLCGHNKLTCGALLVPRHPGLARGLGVPRLCLAFLSSQVAAVHDVALPGVSPCHELVYDVE